MYIYIYIYIYERICVTHCLSCMHTRTHTEGRRGGGAEGWRDKGAEGHRGRRVDGQMGRGAEGRRDWGVEGLGGGDAEWNKFGYVQQLHLGTPMLISRVVR